MLDHYLVCYDIADPRRLRRVARTLEDFGTRLQDSVFECVLRPAELARLQARVLPLLDRTADSVRYIPLCARDLAARQAHWPSGQTPPQATPPGAWVI